MFLVQNYDGPKYTEMSVHRWVNFSQPNSSPSGQKSNNVRSGNNLAKTTSTCLPS